MRQRRTDLGYQLVDLSRVTGLSGRELYMIENGVPSSEEKKKIICKALALTVEEIFEK